MLLPVILRSFSFGPHQLIGTYCQELWAPCTCFGTIGCPGSRARRALLIKILGSERLDSRPNSFDNFK
jgi:hypothetical protein